MICGAKKDHNKKKTQIYIKSVVLNFHGGGEGVVEVIRFKMSNKPPGAVKIHIVL